MTYTINGVNGYDLIDNATTAGLRGTSNSLAYRVAVIERHAHSGGRWFGKAATPSGEDHVADRIGSNNGAFQIDAGNDTWGAWVQIMGATDTPADTGKLYFDPHEIVVSAAERTGLYYIQIGRGASGAAALTAGTYTEFALDETDRAGGSIVTVQTGRAPAGSKLWARCMCPGQNTATLDFVIGVHEYEG
jgi:hypothetical protein